MYCENLKYFQFISVFDAVSKTSCSALKKGGSVEGSCKILSKSTNDSNSVLPYVVLI